VFYMKLYKCISRLIIKAILRNARCNNKVDNQSMQSQVREGKIQLDTLLPSSVDAGQLLAASALPLEQVTCSTH